MTGTGTITPRDEEFMPRTFRQSRSSRKPAHRPVSLREHLDKTSYSVHYTD